MNSDEVEKALKHFGVKGMRWGVRRKRNDSGSGGSSTSSGKKKPLGWNDLDEAYSQIDTKKNARINAAKIKEKEARKKAKDEFWDDVEALESRFEEPFSKVALRFDKKSRDEYKRLDNEEKAAFAEIQKKHRDKVRAAKIEAKTAIKKAKEDAFDEAWDLEEGLTKKAMANEKAQKEAKAAAKAAKRRGSDDNARVAEIKKKKLKDMSDEELEVLTKRASLVEEYKSLTPLLSGRRKDTSQLSNSQLNAEIKRQKLKKADWEEGVRKDKRIDDMTDIEVERTAARHAMEQKYKDLNQKQIDRSYQVAKTFFTIVAVANPRKKRNG